MGSIAPRQHDEPPETPRASSNGASFPAPPFIAMHALCQGLESTRVRYFRLFRAPMSLSVHRCWAVRQSGCPGLELADAGHASGEAKRRSRDGV